jgi:hypothetical protein
LWLVLVVWSGQCAGAPAAAPEAVFLAALSGDWRGSAVQTPAGPFSYDIRFEPVAGGCRAGVAEPGGVHHYWKFCPAEAGLELEFLSDFRGNEQPLFLQLHDIDAGTLLFHSQSHTFLKVRARIDGGCLLLQVLHHDRLHVEIHLSRAPPDASPPVPDDCARPAPVSESGQFR